MESLIRANWTRMFLEHMRSALSPAQLEQVLARAGSARLALVDGAGPLAWLDADAHMGLLEAELGVLGPRAHEQFWRTMTRASFDRPIFRTLAQGALALFGLSAGKFLRITPQGWALITRGCGELTSQTGQTEASMVWGGIPLTIRRSPAFATAWVGSLLAMMDLTSARGDVAVDLKDLAVGTVRYTMRWR